MNITGTSKKRKYEQQKSILATKFRVKREEKFSNYFMNEDTIALAVKLDDIDDLLYVDTGSADLQVRLIKEIDRAKNFWLKPTFWRQSNVSLRKFNKGKIGFRTWPSLNTIRHKNGHLSV
jgi:hypothetical protein